MENLVSYNSVGLGFCCLENLCLSGESQQMILAVAIQQQFFTRKQSTRNNFCWTVQVSWGNMLLCHSLLCNVAHNGFPDQPQPPFRAAAACTVVTNSHPRKVFVTLGIAALCCFAFWCFRLILLLQMCFIMYCLFACLLKEKKWLHYTVHFQLTWS